jgi:hypothetical protein
MKMPTINGAITVHGDQTEARNIEKEYTPGRKNVHTIKEEERRNRKCEATSKSSSCRRNKKVPLDSLVPDKQVIIGTGLYQEEENRLIEFL